MNTPANLDAISAKRPTPWGTRPLEDLVLAVKGNFRRVMRPVLDQATGDLREFQILVQRKGPKENWVDHPIPADDLTRTKAGEIKTLRLGKEECKALIGHLETLAKAAGLNLSDPSLTTLAALPKGQADLLPLLRQADETYLAQVLKEKPHIADSVRLQQRRDGLVEFEQKLNDANCKEGNWKDFFGRHKWVFGLGLDLRYLEELQMEATVGGAGLNGKGAAIADGMLATTSDNARYTVTLEIKTHQTDLLEAYKSRELGGAWKASGELAGGIAQLQNYCYRWEREGQDSDQNKQATDGVDTVWPRGILVIGCTKEFEKDPMKKKAFQRLRESLHTPTIIAFDELYQRAKFIVEDEVNNG